MRRRIAAVVLAATVAAAGCGDIHTPTAAEKACIYKYSGKRLLAENPSIGKVVATGWAEMGKKAQAHLIALCLRDGY